TCAEYSKITSATSPAHISHWTRTHQNPVQSNRTDRSGSFSSHKSVDFIIDRSERRRQSSTGWTSRSCKSVLRDMPAESALTRRTHDRDKPDTDVDQSNTLTVHLSIAFLFS